MLASLRTRLNRYGQQHLLDFWDRLDTTARAHLAQQIAAVDFELVARLFRETESAIDWGRLAERADSPPAIRRDRPAEQARRAREAGEKALRAGDVGVVLVAGGQGTRLGFPHPKGMFPVGIVSRRTLFQILIDHLLAVSRRYGATIPLYIMVSPATREETIAYFEQHDYFGLAGNCQIFCQGTMPAVDAQSGRVLLETPESLALSPDGHGGLVAALEANHVLDDMRRRGIRQLFYAQIDNPLAQIADPELIGHHLRAESEMTTQVVPKRDPLERVGNVVAIDGRVQIIEYSDLPDTAARLRAADGSLKLWAGNMAIHVFDVAFLDRALRQTDMLPFHRARKKVSYCDASGKTIEPAEPNAIKFERFVFDLLPAARNAIVVEADPAEAFAPVKNANGAPTDTPETAQQAMVALHARWLRDAGALVEHGIPVEIHPGWALDQQECARKVEPGLRVTRATFFC